MKGAPVSAASHSHYVVHRRIPHVLVQIVHEQRPEIKIRGRHRPPPVPIEEYPTRALHTRIDRFIFIFIVVVRFDVRCCFVLIDFKFQGPRLPL